MLTEAARAEGTGCERAEDRAAERVKRESLDAVGRCVQRVSEAAWARLIEVDDRWQGRVAMRRSLGMMVVEGGSREERAKGRRARRATRTSGRPVKRPGDRPALWARVYGRTRGSVRGDEGRRC